MMGVDTCPLRLPSMNEAWDVFGIITLLALQHESSDFADV